MQEVRDQALTIALSLFVSIWFQDLFHSPYRGSFHLSLTVLVHYRSVSSILPWRGVPPASNRISRVPSYSGYSLTLKLFQIRDHHPLWCAFPDASLIVLISYASPTTPANKLSGLGIFRFRSPLLTESQLITFPAGT